MPVGKIRLVRTVEVNAPLPNLLVHIHGAVLSSWVVLLIVPPVVRHLPLHQTTNLWVPLGVEFLRARIQKKNPGDDVEHGGRSAGVGFWGFGSMLAITISWSVNHSISWMVLQGILSWLYND